MTAKSTRTAIWLRIFCAALLLSLGFAHKPLYAAPSSNPVSSFYALPDGSFAGLCIGSDQGKPGKSWLGCEACRLAANVLLPAPPADHASAPRNFRSIEDSPRSTFLGTALPRPGYQFAARLWSSLEPEAQACAGPIEFEGRHP